MRFISVLMKLLAICPRCIGNLRGIRTVRLFFHQVRGGALIRLKLKYARFVLFEKKVTGFILLFFFTILNQSTLLTLRKNNRSVKLMSEFIKTVRRNI